MRLQSAAALILFILISGCALAQDLGGFVGTVTDPSGAPIPGTDITVSNPAKGFLRHVTSNNDGGYVVPRAPLGSYVITAEKSGFQKLVRTAVTLSAGDTLRVDFALQVGSVSEQITVNSAAAKVDTESGAISDVVTGSQVTQLNLNARNFANLATLVPGAASLSTGFDPSSVGVLANATIAFNGVPGNFNNWEIDGVNNVDQGSGSNSLMVYPSVDSIAEFRISTSNYSAEYGKSGGGNIEVVTKSGTRDFHGDLFEFVRNDKFDANDWFINRTITGDGSSAPKTPLKRNNFGFTIGGPIVIPGHYNVERNKTFFFVSEEWRKNREGTVIDREVPTVRMRDGDFSECNAASPNYNAVVASGCALPVDPTTGLLYPNDKVPINSTGAALLNGLVPLPNNGVNRYTTAPSLPTNFRQDMVRVDENFTDNLRLFVRYTQDAYEQEFVPSLWTSADFATVKSTWTSPAKSFVTHLTQILTPNLLNEVIVSFS
ncbi:MAG TPA: carboxypeptidase-like regulatory domain-containing protein, partial [Candidatus Obscuribacterales bacterium]